jgi:cell division protein FtsW
MVFNASYPLATEIHGDPWYFLKRQALSAVIGMGGLFLALRMPYWWLRKVAVAGLIATIALLALVLVMGHTSLGAQRWIGWGPLRFQPSEFAKLTVVLYVAHLLAANPRLMRNFWGGVIPLLLGLLVFVILPVELQPDLGTAITLLVTVLLLFFAGGAKTRWMIGLLVFFGACALGLALKDGTDGYRWKRVITFINPAADPLDAGYQITHSKIALGTGGLMGVGFGESREKLRGNLPAQRTDFIFAIVGEEMGLAGTCGTLLLFLIFAGRGFHIATRTKNRFGALLATGLTGMIATQALINIAVVTASVPATGVPLPFLSFGGSSLMTTLFAVGILLNVSRYPYREDDPRPVRRRGGAGKRA